MMIINGDECACVCWSYNTQTKVFLLGIWYQVLLPYFLVLLCWTETEQQHEQIIPDQTNQTESPNQNKQTLFVSVLSEKKSYCVFVDLWLCLVHVSLPLSVYVFTLPLPYIGVASTLPQGFVLGVAILVVGMLIYSWSPSLGPTPRTTTTAHPHQA
uniref:Uncharacterized protein n=1 Tax=Nelumbo nucifera TaxID=4432 RepID=A0A822ZE63_NELNU|nr:TPA_asm: hypothetical protein HUJ06_001020 [Nelumbo nucifera]